MARFFLLWCAWEGGWAQLGGEGENVSWNEVSSLSLIFVLGNLVSYILMRIMKMYIEDRERNMYLQDLDTMTHSEINT